MGCHGLTSESTQRMKGSTNVGIREWLLIRHSLTPSFVGIRAFETGKYQNPRWTGGFPFGSSRHPHRRSSVIGKNSTSPPRSMRFNEYLAKHPASGRRKPAGALSVRPAPLSSADLPRSGAGELLPVSGKALAAGDQWPRIPGKPAASALRLTTYRCKACGAPVG
jgi:hypothetical protein